LESKRQKEAKAITHENELLLKATLKKNEQKMQLKKEKINEIRFTKRHLIDINSQQGKYSNGYLRSVEEEEYLKTLDEERLKRLKAIEVQLMKKYISAQEKQKAELQALRDKLATQANSKHNKGVNKKESKNI